MTAYVADGTTFGRSNSGSPEIFTTVAQVRSIGSLGKERQLIDATNLASTLREWVKAIPDGMELNLELQYDMKDTGHASLFADVDADSPINYRVTFPSSPVETWTFPGLVTKFEVANVEIDNILTANVTVKPTGSLTVA